MSTQEIDDYLASLDPPKGATLEQLRSDILSFVPEAEPCPSYSAPAFRPGGKVVAGFSAAARPLSYLPHSGTVLASMAFNVDEPLPRELVGKLIAARRAELGL